MDKATIVTGASSGIGRSICKVLLKNGKTVIGGSRKLSGLQACQKEFSEYKGEFIPLEIDVSDPANVKKVIDKVSKDYSIECIINNAGVTSFESAEENSIEDIQNIINTNLLGPIYGIKNLLPSLVQNKGLIVNILSVAAIKIFTNSSAYAASKAGLLAYSNVLREELREHNVRVVNILPGATKTPIWPNDALEQFSDRMMSPEDIAEIVYQVFSNRKNIVQEEIVLRPVKGDL